MGLFSRIISKLSGAEAVSPAEWGELERELMESDLGRELTHSIVEAAKKEKGDSPSQRITKIIQEHLSTKNRALADSGIILIVGVNGTGKTTSSAKLAAYIKGKEKSVLLAAADTFRAAAVEQLCTWGERLGVDVITGKGDSASVSFDATTRYLDSKSDYLIIDTAGRLHTKSDLMDELGKVKRVIEKRAQVAEVLLVIDGTTGQNGLAQAKIFTEAVEITGLIVTKLDGSARGGIALAIESSLDIPIKFIGTGEAAQDLAPFDREAYLRELIS